MKRFNLKNASLCVCSISCHCVFVGNVLFQTLGIVKTVGFAAITSGNNNNNTPRIGHGSKWGIKFFPIPKWPLLGSVFIVFYYFHILILSLLPGQNIL